MRVLMMFEAFALGDGEGYAVGVAEELERLGHPVLIQAAAATREGRDLASARAVRLDVGGAAELDEVDAVLLHDEASAAALAEATGSMPRVLAIDGVGRDVPALREQLAAVAVNGRSAARLAGSSGLSVARLRQPVVIERFRPRAAPRERARRVLIVGDRPSGGAALLRRACARLELELTSIRESDAAIHPQGEISDADIVVGEGRLVLEALAMRRAAYVWGAAGCDGWLTPHSYEVMEADGFRGTATDAVASAESLMGDLAAYRPHYGELGFDLVRRHHSATKHVEALLGLFDVSAAGPPGATEALSLLVRIQARAAIRVERLEAERELLGKELAARRGRAEAAEQRVARLQRSRSWRLAAPLRRIRGFRRGA